METPNFSSSTSSYSSSSTLLNSFEKSKEQLDDQSMMQTLLSSTESIVPTRRPASPFPFRFCRTKYGFACSIDLKRQSFSWNSQPLNRCTISLHMTQETSQDITLGVHGVSIYCRVSSIKTV